jgi:ribosomal protein L15
LKANKLLWSGEATRKYSIKCDFATASAIEKIKSLGGIVTVKPVIERPVVEETPKKKK